MGDGSPTAPSRPSTWPTLHYATLPRKPCICRPLPAGTALSQAHTFFCLTTCFTTASPTELTAIVAAPRVSSVPTDAPTAVSSGDLIPCKAQRAGYVTALSYFELTITDVGRSPHCTITVESNQVDKLTLHQLLWTSRLPPRRTRPDCQLICRPSMPPDCRNPIQQPRSVLASRSIASKRTKFPILPELCDHCRAAAYSLGSCSASHLNTRLSCGSSPW